MAENSSPQENDAYLACRKSGFDCRPFRALAEFVSEVAFITIVTRTIARAPSGNPGTRLYARARRKLVLERRDIQILIVEDDPDMAELISDLAESEGWTPISVPSAEEARRVLSERNVDLALIDHNLPGLSGRAFAQRLREENDIGIIMVTAAGSAAERVLGLETAADDYVVKPFEPIELVARIKAVLRRSNHHARSEPDPDRTEETGPTLRIGDWAIDLKARRATCLGNPAITLTSSEFALLEILAETPGEPVERVRILNRLGADDDRYVDRNVDVLVLRLRRKIEVNPNLPRHIKTRRGKGYVLVTDIGGEEQD
jgi:DNA-binding response OmpR family regulator